MVDVQRKILVVDDTAMFRELSSIFLSRFGPVVTACSGASALQLMEAQRPSVVVTDLHMPGMAGDELCARIRRNPAFCDTPVIILTSGDDAADHARAVRAGANDIVSKPISRMNLVESVGRSLRSPDHSGLARVDLATKVCIRRSGVEAWGRGINLSRGGMFIEAEALMPDRTEVELEFQLPEAGPLLHSTARVVWAREASTRGDSSGMGLQFLAIDRDASRQIESFVFERARFDAVPASARASSAA